jgi:cytochrome c peroxidase
MRRLLFALLFLALACTKHEEPHFPRLARFEPMKIPANNPLTPEKVELGRKLFFDTRLSFDNATSCSGCHDPGHGYTVGASGGRACPSLINTGYAKGYFWEGAPIPLEKAVKGMWTFAMMPKGTDPDSIAARVGLKSDDVANALASYIRTLVPENAPWVRFYGGETAALSETARRGYIVFDERARCTNCHSGVLLTDRLRHDVGTGNAYKTPTLLNIARSAPYFHDNRVATLEEAVDRMLAGGFETKTPDPQLKAPKTPLTAEERAALLAFLRELNADVTPPTR